MEYSYKDRTATIYIDGDIDHHSFREISQYMSKIIATCLPRTLIIDMRCVSFMDSSGLALAIGGQHRMSELGGKLIIRNAPHQAMRVFNAAGIGRLIEFENTERVI